MFILDYYRADPTDYALLYRNGKIVREGAGIAFYYWTDSSSIVSIPTSTIDAPFILNEMSGNFQLVSVQGQATYRIAQPKTMAGILNFAIHPRTRRYISTDPEKLGQRIINAVQAQIRAELLKRPLQEALREAANIAAAVLAQVKADTTLTAMGVEILNVFINAIKPTPEMAKALEAEYREGLQQRADQAIYARRAAAVEQERRIKENELSTELMLEEKRQGLIELQGNNNKKQAEFEALANDITLGPWRKTDAKTVLALAMKKLGDNAEKIGNLTITPELLSLLKG